MKTLNIIKALGALVLFGAMAAAQAQTTGMPSPCEANGTPGGGPDGPAASADGCVYMDDEGALYNATTGERSGTALVGETVTIDVYMDFTNDQTVGGGFDILYDDAAVQSASWSFDAGFPQSPAFQTNGMETPDAYVDIGFGAFDGYGGEDDPVEMGSNPNPGLHDGFQFIGTLTVVLAAGFVGTTSFDFMEATDPPPEAPGPFTSNEGADQDVAFFAYNLTVVPLPGAVWLMLSGLGALIGFGRRKVSGAASA